jgi:hypothetical protein
MKLRIIAWLWLLTFLPATVGVNLHRIYCACSGSVSVSLWSKSLTDCASTSIAVTEKASCCKPPSKEPSRKSCCAPVAKPLGGLCDSAGKCMDDQSVFVKLSTDLEPQVQQNTSDLFVFFTFEPCFITDTYHESVSYNAQSIATHQRPCQPYGRYLLPYIQSWLC